MFFLQKGIFKATPSFLSVAFFITSSCSLRIPGKQAVSITTSEKDAAIYVDNTYVGKGKASVLLSKGETHAISSSKGNRFASASIDYHLSPTGLLDLIGGCILLFPALGFLSNGAWQLDTNQIHLEIQ